MAYGGDALLDRVLSSTLEVKTRFTITDADELSARIDVARKRGFSESDQTNEEDVHGIAAPIFDRMSVACGAVSVSTPSHRMTDEQRQLTIGAVLRAASTITDGLGGKQPRSYANLIAPLMVKS